MKVQLLKLLKIIKQNKMNKIWFSSDFHYGHTNICYGVSNWTDKETTTRKFNTVERMNQAIIDAINNTVAFDDTLYFLGDWSFGGIENIWEFRQRIVCKDIHFIMGNHDHHIKKNKILPNCHGTVIEFSYGLDKLKYIADGANLCTEEHFHEYFVYAPQLFTSVHNYLELEIKNHTFVLSHYPIEEWFKMDKGSIHLHGHCHGKINRTEINTKYRRLDVGIDWKEFRPYSLEEVIQLVGKREIKKHNS